jgi:hypothetical protein
LRVADARTGWVTVEGGEEEREWLSRFRAQSYSRRRERETRTTCRQIDRGQRRPAKRVVDKPGAIASDHELFVGAKLPQSHINRAAKEALLIPKLVQPSRPRSLDVADQAQIIARSDWSWGTLDRLDPETGASRRRYETAPGTEGIAFGSNGRLWAVSEAGSRHIYDYPILGLFEPFFPLVFALDLSRLE